MTSGPQEQAAAPRAPGEAVPPPLREDLVVKHVRYIGRDYVVFKNRISLEYFRLARHHYEAAQLFDGRRTLISILRQLQERDRVWAGLPGAEAINHLAQLVNQLGFQGLLQTSAGHTLQRFEQKRQMMRARLLEVATAKLMFFRRSLWDPDPFLGKVTPAVRWLFTGWFAVFFALFALSALLVVGANMDQAAARLANFFTLPNLLLSWGILILIKSLHEFGHGVASKHYGGEVHEMGLLMIIFTPYFYCNVSDAWMLPHRRHRMLIGSAGILVELFVAAVAAWLWVLTQPGFFNQTCFNVMLMCSVSTFVFNANPLLKFDGYYVLADYLEIPNLKQKSNQYVTSWAQQRLLGMKVGREGYLAHEAGAWFGLYAVASYFYMWFVLFAISFYLFNVLEPFGLEVFSRVYVILFLGVVCLLPFYRLLKAVAAQREAWPVIGRRMGFAGVVLALAAGISFVVPWQDNVRQAGVVKFAQVDQVAAPLQGFVREVFVREGSFVEAGQPLLRLENANLEFHLRDLTLQRESLRLQLQAARVHGQLEGLGPAYYTQLIAEAEEELALMESRLEECLIRAPRAGVVRGRDLERLAGQFLRRGEPICSIGVGNDLRLIISLREHEARRVEPGAIASAKFFAYPGEKVEGVLPRMAVGRSRVFADQNLAGRGMMSIPTVVSPDGQARPAVPYFEVEMHLPAETAFLREGMVARVNISAAETTLGLWCLDRFWHLLDAKVRL
jgi:putative peptide zinc metalloprotease protein